MKLKIGLDIHGVIDAMPEIFGELSRTLFAAGHEVHILTGPRRSMALETQLYDAGICWSHIFSITDYCISQGLHVEWDAKGDPTIDDREWDKAKGKYCEEQGIHLHLDDSDTYKYFFKTPYARVYSRDTLRIKKIKV